VQIKIKIKKIEIIAGISNENQQSIQKKSILNESNHDEYN